MLFRSSIFPSIRVFSNESVLHIRWPKCWSFSISPSNECHALLQGLFVTQGCSCVSYVSCTERREEDQQEDPQYSQLTPPASALSETSPTCIHFKSSQPSSGLLLNHIVFHMEPSTSRAERNPEMCSASGPFGQLGPPLIPVGPAQSCRAPCPGAKARGGRSCPRHLPQTRPAQHPTYSTRWGWTPSARRRSFRWPRGCEPGSSVLAWRVPGTGEPGGLPSMLPLG